MERVLYNFHSQVCGVALRRTSSTARSLCEKTILLLALAGFGVLFVTHVGFVHHPQSMVNSSGGGGGGTSFIASRRHSIPYKCLSSINGFRWNVDVTHVVLLPPEEENNTLQEGSTTRTTRTTIPQQSYAATLPILRLGDDDNSDESSPGCTLSDCYHNNCHNNGILVNPLKRLDALRSLPIQFSYTTAERGFLLLTDKIRSHHNITTQYVGVSRSDTNCFGEPFLQSIVTLVGTDAVVVNWLLGAIAANEGDHHPMGFIYNPRSHTMRLLSHNGPESPSSSSEFPQVLLWKFGVVLTSIFLFFITTTLTSFTLRETQQRMLEFTLHLQEHVRAQRHLGRLIVRHVMESLVFCPIMVGMMFFLIEFYGGDKVLAFWILSLVWVCEVFSAVSLRSWQGMRFFPKIFFLLFLLFHVYFFSCPYGFHYTALTTFVMFWMHSMIFFWNRYELPAFAHGRVSVQYPRMTPSRAPPSNPNANTAATSTSAGGGSSPGAAPRPPVRNQPPAPTRPPQPGEQTTSTPSIHQRPLIPRLVQHRSAGAEGAADVGATTPVTISLTPRRSASNTSLMMAATSAAANVSSIQQQHQYPSMSSLGGSGVRGELSRPPSFLFQPYTSAHGSITGSGNDDDDASFLVFLNGEVVMRRPESSSSTAGGSNTPPSSTMPTSTNNHGTVPEGITISCVLTPLTRSTSSTSTQDMMMMQENHSSPPEQRGRENGGGDDDRDGIDLTPRTGSLSVESQYHTTTMTQEQEASVPFLSGASWEESSLRRSSNSTHSLAGASTSSSILQE